MLTAGLHRRGGRPHRARGRRARSPPPGARQRGGLMVSTPAPAPSTSRRSAPSSRSWPARCTASRWSTWTAPPPPRSREAVINAMTGALWSSSYANVHRGLHTLANETTDAYEDAPPQAVAAVHQRRRRRDRLLPRAAPRRSTWWPHGFGRGLKAGDEIVLSEMEHHANIVPWHFLRERKGVVLKFIPVTRRRPAGHARPTRACSTERHQGSWRCTHMSNVLGTVNPVAEVVPPWPMRPAPRCCSTAARPWSTSRVDVKDAGRRLLRLLRPQALRPHRHRRALRQGRAARPRCRRTRAAAR